DLLTLTRELLVKPGTDAVSTLDYPDHWQQGALRLPLTYEFAPGSETDGVTVHIPVAQLSQVSPDGFDWQVPGLRRELITAMLRSLPKTIRRNLVPVPDYAAALHAALPQQPDGPLAESLATTLLALTGITVNHDDFSVDRVPDHLRMTF